MLGYIAFEGYSWVDSFLIASMLMGGMGPVGELHTAAGKVFAGFYALYCGLVELVAVGIFAAPIRLFFTSFPFRRGTETKIKCEKTAGWARAVWQTSLAAV